MFTIATYNTNSVRARLPIIESYIKALHPDCLCLQETKVVDEDFPRDTFEKMGYHTVFKGQKSYNGVAVISLHPIEDVTFGFNDDEDRPEDRTRLIQCRVKDISIINTYVPQGRDITHEQYQIKLRWFRRLKKLFDTKYSKDSDLIWCGDLNVAPTEIDVYAPEKKTKHVCFHQDVRQAYHDVLNWGLIDIFRKFHPDPGHYSFFDYRIKDAVKRGLGWRIDHILATRNLADRAVSANIDVEYRLVSRPSDHTFLRASFK